MDRLENQKNVIMYLMADEHVSYQNGAPVSMNLRCDIRFPFEQMAAQLPDTTLVRFNRDFPQPSLQGIKNYVGITEDVTKII